MRCRHCSADLSLTLIHLGNSPPSNAYLSEAALSAPEQYFPLRVLVCSRCWLAQTEDYANRDALFTPDYAYYSSFSATTLAHAETFVAEAVGRFGIDKQSCVVEVAANDGYLLQYVQAYGIPCYGVEPTKSTAAAARAKGLDIIEDFFGMALAEKLADEGRKADLMVANNVLAHVPDINDFVAGFAHLLKPRGVASFEFPHLLRLVEGNQFDTIYHEHYSYLSLHTIRTVFAANDLQNFDVEELSVHGGSLRVWAQRRDTGDRQQTGRVEVLLRAEERAGMLTQDFYHGFQKKADKIKNELLRFLLDAWRDGKKIVAYGAAAKGNTLLNYAGVRSDLLPFVVDLNPAKQNRFLPGSHIPVVGEAPLREIKPDYLLILPWNLRKEITSQLSYVAHWGGHFVVAVPQLEVWRAG
ncbi:Methylation protein EvaC [Gammaproteobacteria bacterium]